MIDPFALIMGREDKGSRLALDFIEAIVKELYGNITLGCSNIAFGIPDHVAINAFFIAMALRCEWAVPISNPSNEQINLAISGDDLCM